MKNFLLPLMCLLAGGVAGYGLRSVNNSSSQAPSIPAAAKDKGAVEARQKSGIKPADQVSNDAGGRSAKSPKRDEKSLADRMKELLVDYDTKSARKVIAKLSLAELKDALALAADLPKSSDRDSLREQLYHAWAALEPSAAWQAALADPQGKNSGKFLGAVAAEVAKNNPEGAIKLALSLGMGTRRGAVLNAVFSEWSKTNLPAAIAYSNAHPEVPVDSSSFSNSLSQLAEKNPLNAANLAIAIGNMPARKFMLSNLMEGWTTQDPEAAMSWAQGLANPALREDAVAAVIGAWIKNDPAAALTRAQSFENPDARTNALKHGWTSWFRSDPLAATSYLAAPGNEELRDKLGYMIGLLADSFTPKERAGLLAQLPEGKAREDMLRSLTDSQIRKGQFNESIELLNAMPDSLSRDRSLQELGEKWAAADLSAATDWLKRQPDSSDRDLAVAGYSRALARNDPLAAVDWAKTIVDDKARKGAMKNIGIRWYGFDAAKAEAWIGGVPEFSESDKKIIRDFGARHLGDTIGLPVSVGARR